MPFSYMQAVIATAMVSIGITTGFDRRFRVLVRLGTTPLGRRGLIYSKILSVLIAQLFQLLVLSIVGILLGWEPQINWISAFIFCWIASCAFVGIALLIAGQVRAEANLGLQNLMYIVMIGLGALSFGSESLPSSLEVLSLISPSGALHTLLRYSSSIESFSVFAFISIVIQAIFWPLLAARRFSFDES